MVIYPHAFLSPSGKEHEQYLAADAKQTGRVCYINEAHQYYRVEFKIRGMPMYECFKFEYEE